MDIYFEMCEAARGYLFKAWEDMSFGDRFYVKIKHGRYSEGINFLDTLTQNLSRDKIFPLPTQNQIQRWIKEYLPEEQAIFQSFLLKRWIVNDTYSFDQLWLMFFMYYIHNLYWDQTDYEWREIPEERSYRISS
jgi:hypothetical protein